MNTRFAALMLLSVVELSGYAQQVGTFTATGSMTSGRYGSTGTLLQTGKVLIAGGYLSNTGTIASTASAELYDPSTGTFAATGSMTMARWFHAATLLPDGKVLVTGGDALTSTTDIYDPSTGAFTTAPMLEPNYEPSIAVLLANGKVLVYHGNFVFGSGIVPAAELYDPVTSTFSAAAQPLSGPGVSFLGTALNNGSALLAFSDFAELYDPVSGTFRLTATPDPNLLYEYAWAGVPLTNGKVLLTGGYNANTPNYPFSAGAQLYDPSTGTFAPTGDMTTGRAWHTATPLGDGTVLIAGSEAQASANSAEVYDPGSGTFSPTGNMSTSQLSGHTATLLPDGTVLIAGGNSNLTGVALSSAEIDKPSVPVSSPMLFSVAGNGNGQGAIWHAATGQIVSADNPAVAGEALSMYTTSLVRGGVVPPQLVVGGRLAEIFFFGDAPGYAGYFQVNFQVPAGVAAGSAISVRLSYMARPSNEVTIGVH